MNYTYGYQSFYNSGYNPYVRDPANYYQNSNGYNQNNYNYNQNSNATNNMYSTQNNYNNNFNKTIPKINLNEALSRSKYPKINQDYIRDFMIDTFGNKQGLKVYLYEKIFLIEYEINIIINKNIGKSYKVNLLLYIPELFPDYEPELYLKNTGGNFSINMIYDKAINKTNLKINSDQFCKYDQVTQNIGEVIEVLKAQFQSNFPVYQDKNKNTNYSGKCCVNNSALTEVEIPKKEKYNEQDILKLMRKKTKELLTQKYNQTIKKSNIINDYNELNQMNYMLKANLNINNKNGNNNNEPISKEITTLKEIKQQLKNVENNLQREIQGLKEKQNKSSIFDDCENVVRFKDQEMVKLAAMQKAIEDYLSYLKKGFEKNKVSMEECIRQTRELSRNLFHIYFLMKKRKEENE